MPNPSTDRSRTGERVPRVAPNSRAVQDAQTALDCGRSPRPGASPGPGTLPAPGTALTADERAEQVVTAATDEGMLVLNAPGAPPVTLGPYPNPGVLRGRVTAVRRFAAALIRSAHPVTTPRAPKRAKRRSSGRTRDGGYPADSDLHRMADDGGPLSSDPARWTDPAWCDTPDGGRASPASGTPLRASPAPPPEGIGGPLPRQEG